MPHRDLVLNMHRHKGPFKIKGKETEYTQCIKKGDDRICATRLSKKGEMKKYAFCEEKKTQKKKKIMIKKKIPEAFESTEYRVPELKMVSPEVYELPNRKNFVNFQSNYKTLEKFRYF